MIRQFIGLVLVSAFAIVPTVQAQDEAAEPAATQPAAEAAEATEAAPAKPKGLESNQQQLGYAIGLGIGQNMREGFLKPEDLDLKAFQKGVVDGLNGGEPALSNEEIDAIFKKFSEMMMARRQEEIARMMQDNLETAKKFLAENGKAEGVKTTDSGLQYMVLKSGEEGGASPKMGDTVSVTYRGTFLDGSMFDESQQPISFKLGEVIEGWNEALALMKVGDKFKLFIPPDLAYGQRGNQRIPPNSMLLFEVELLGVIPAAKEDAGE